MNIIQCLTEVMRSVGAVRKAEKNTHQHFNFRGIDTVVNAVYPALVDNGVVVVPEVLESDYTNVEVGSKRTPMAHARVTVRYTFYGPEGDSVSATVAAEAMDSGDKATAKVMSVAFRTALLQSLCLPTDEPDPDSDSYQRSPAFDEDGYLATVEQKLDAADTVDKVRALWQEVAQSALSQDTREETLERIKAKGSSLAEEQS